MDKNPFRLDPSTYKEIPMARDIPFPVVPHLVDNITPDLDRVRDVLSRPPIVIIMVFEVTRSLLTIAYTHTTASMVAFGRTPLSTFKTMKRDMLRLGTIHGLNLKLVKILRPDRLVEFAEKNDASVNLSNTMW